MRTNHLYFSLVFLMSITASYAQKITRGPYLQVVNSNSIIIRWRTDIWSNSQVYYGTKEGVYDKITSDKALVNEHIIKITNLQPQTRYYYKIGYDTVIFQGTQQYFTTAPLSNSPKKMRFAVYGDCGQGSQTQRDINKAFLYQWRNTRPDLMLLAGDNAYYSGTEYEYQNNFFNIYQDSLLKNIPLYPVLGNHDYGNNEIDAAKREVNYFKVFTTPQMGESGGIPSNSPSYYSFNYGNTHFVILDTYGTEGGKKLYDTTSTQARWLKTDLTNNKAIWTIVLGHHPPYTKGTHNSDTESDLVAIRERIVPILERYGVDMAVFGHSHVYERSYLIKNHLGMDNTFSNKHKVSSSNASYTGIDTTCFYRLPLTQSPHGTVYVVAGSAGNAGTAYSHASFPHRGSAIADKEKGGIFCFEIEDNRLDAFFIRTDTTIKDRFTMMKNVGKRTIINQYINAKDSIELKASFIGNYKWTSGQNTRSIKIKLQEEGLFRYIVQDSFKCVTDTFDLNLILSNTTDTHPSFQIKQLSVIENQLQCSIENNAQYNLNIQIVDLLGHRVFNQDISAFHKESSIKATLSSGIFLLNITNEKGHFLNRKIIVY